MWQHAEVSSLRTSWLSQVKAAQEAYAARVESERQEREAQLQRQAAAERLRVLEDEEQRHAEAVALSQEREASAALTSQPAPGADPGEITGLPDAAVPNNAAGRIVTTGAADTAMQGVELKRKQLRAVELRVCFLGTGSAAVVIYSPAATQPIWSTRQWKPTKPLKHCMIGCRWLSCKRNWRRKVRPEQKWMQGATNCGGNYFRKWSLARPWS